MQEWRFSLTCIFAYFIQCQPQSQQLNVQCYQRRHQNDVVALAFLFQSLNEYHTLLIFTAHLYFECNEQKLLKIDIKTLQNDVKLTQS